jgi:CRP-like cAMP-binding protein
MWGVAAPGSWVTNSNPRGNDPVSAAGESPQRAYFLPVIDPARLAQLPCFVELTDEECARVADLFTETNVAAGDEVVIQGDFAYEFFVIDDGTAEVRENGLRVAEIGRGDFFGELGLLVTGRRTATVVATSPTRLFVLFDQDFRRLERDVPDFAQSLRETMSDRFHR